MDLGNLSHPKAPEVPIPHLKTKLRLSTLIPYGEVQRRLLIKAYNYLFQAGWP